MYTYKINIGSYTNPVVGSGYITCNPITEGVKLVKERENEYVKIVRLNLEGKLKFRDLTYGNKEFTVINELVEAGTQYIPIQILYNNVVKLTGRLDLYGEYDYNKHICALKVFTEDSYSELMKLLDTEVNILNATAQDVYTNVLSYLITRVSEETYLAPQQMIVVMFGDDADLWTLTNTQTIPPAPAPAVQDPSYIYTYTSNAVNFAADGYRYWAGIYLKQMISTEYVRSLYDRFRLLSDVVAYIFNELDLDITINTATYCPYFDIDTEMKYLMIADKSDIKRHTSTNAAIYEWVKVEDIFKIYKQIANLDWYIENNEFKLALPNDYDLADFSTYPEHELTENGYQYNIQRISYQNEKVNKETWSFEDTFNNDFRNKSILYENYEKRTDEKSLPLLNCDFEYVITNPDDINDDGVVVVACSYTSGQYRIINKTGYLNIRPFINGKLSTTHIIHDHMIYDRPYPSGTFLDESIALFEANNKEVEYSNFPIYDPDKINFNYCLNTELGSVYPYKLEIDVNKKEFSKFVGRITPSVLKTVEPTYIRSTEALTGGTILSTTDLVILSKGVCYSESHNPTIADSKTVNGSGKASYTSQLTSLTPETKYYIRAYITTADITIYGNELSLTTSEVEQYSITVNDVYVDKIYSAEIDLTVTSAIDMTIVFSIYTGTWKMGVYFVEPPLTNENVLIKITTTIPLSNIPWKLETVIDGVRKLESEGTI